MVTPPQNCVQRNTMPTPNSRIRKRSIYSKGEVNRLIDCLLHPLFDVNPAFRLVDTILHGFAERKPPETAVKFLRYNLSRIVVEFSPKKKNYPANNH